MKKIHLIGNSHLDPVWLWQWQEGLSEIKATFRSALDRMKEFDDFIFTSACGCYYMWIEQSDPKMFSEIQQRVKEGRWCLVGGWFLQPDCNIPSGESFARHGLITQRYFKDRFGHIAKTGYNVDSFGHNGNLPMILKNSGMEQYVFMRPQPHEKALPQSLFLWESADESCIATYRIPFFYNIDESRLEVFDQIDSMDENTDQMAFYGVGNHGGGATVSLLNIMHENLPKHFIYSHPDRFFAEQSLKNLPVVRGDLQFHAKGCYSACAEIKQNNRYAELSLIAAEKLSVLSHQIMKTPYPSIDLKHAWEAILFNQFHDILGGCCIREAYDDARKSHGEAMAISDRISNFATQQISWNIDTLGDGFDVSSVSEEDAERIGLPVVVFNSLDHEVRGVIHLRSAYRTQLYERITDINGVNCPIQTVRDSKTDGTNKYAKIFEAKIPAMGYAVYRLRKTPIENRVENPFTITENSISNGLLNVTFDFQTGEISSLIDQKNGCELLKEKSTLQLFDDTPHDTWAHDISVFDKKINVSMKNVRVKVIEEGPVRATVRVEQSFGSSFLVRDYSLMANSKRLDVRVKIDYREQFRILKFSYPVDIENEECYCKIPFGNIQRPTDGSEQVCGDWVCLKNRERGLVIATDSKHSFDANKNTLSLTVLRSALFSDHYGERDDFCEFMEQGEHRFSYCLFPYRSFADAEHHAQELQNPLVTVRETFHRGTLPLTYQGLYVSEKNVIVTAVKMSEEKDSYVLRCYESEGKNTTCKIRLFDASFDFEIPHHSVKTFLVRGKDIVETNFIEL